MVEIWKDIPGYEGLYQISNFGKVLSLNYKNHGYSRVLVPKCNNAGRLWVELHARGIRKPYLIHRLVAIVFIPNPEGYPQINHKDENPKNNQFDNLEWCTGDYNIRYYLERHRDDLGKNRRASGRYGRRLVLPVKQFSLDGELIRLWDNSRQVSRELGWSDWSISECCRGNRKTAYGFIWQYAS